MATGMSGVWRGVPGQVLDPSASAIRVYPADAGFAVSSLAGGLPVSAPAGGLPISAAGPTGLLTYLPFTAAVLINAANISGTASGGFLDARIFGGGYGAGFWMLQVSGGSASAAFYVSPDKVNWSLLTATAQAANTTSTGQWSGYYPYIAAGPTWPATASSGAVTLTLGIV